jgi:hypothetical protein
MKPNKGGMDWHSSELGGSWTAKQGIAGASKLELRHNPRHNFRSGIDGSVLTRLLRFGHRPLHVAIAWAPLTDKGI